MRSTDVCETARLTLDISENVGRQTRICCDANVRRRAAKQTLGEPIPQFNRPSAGTKRLLQRQDAGNS